MRRLLVLLVCFLLLSIGVSAWAQSQKPVPDTARMGAAKAPPGDAHTIGRSAAAEPLVAVPVPSAKAMSYYYTGNVLWVISTLWGFLVPAVLLFTGISARIRTAARRIGRNWFFEIVLYFLMFLALTSLLDLPLTYYAEFVREHAYGLSNQTFAKWSKDWLTGLILTSLFGSLLLWIPFLLLKKSPKRWWIYTGLLAVPLLVFVVMLEPVFVAPLFNKFGPMKDKALERQIMNLADRAGIQGSRVYEVDKSADTKTLNAYVTGVGATKRIVLWDTIIKKLSPRELLFVMGHEMGHFVLGHIARIIVFMSLLIFIGLYSVHRIAAYMVKKYSSRFGFTDISDVASLPLLILIFSLVFFLLSPVQLAFTRYQEHQADTFGLEITHDNYAAATAFVKLEDTGLGNPRPGRLFVLFRASHPPIGERIDFCNTYRPWERGEPSQFAQFIKR